MTSSIPKPPGVLTTAYGYPQPEAPEAAPACVDCAVEGTPNELTTAYTVAGTILCRKHAIAERKAIAEGAVR